MENVLNKQFVKLKEAMDEILELKQTVCIVSFAIFILINVFIA